MKCIKHKCDKPQHAKGLCGRCYSAEWRLKNTDRYKKLASNWYQNNKEETIKRVKNWKKNNPDKVKAHMNTEKRKRYERDYYINRYKNDINYKIKVVLRNRLRSALKNEFKSGSTIKNIGCSIEELKKHLESQFQPGMSWDNWSRNGWHIDHIRPLDDFDLSNPDQVNKACHYSNLQPLWAEDNTSKNSNKSIVYLVCGVPGVGKTTILSKFKDKANCISYDNGSKADHLKSMYLNKISIYDIPFKISNFIKDNSDKLDIRPVFIIEDEQVIGCRINSRGGSFSDAMTARMRRIQRLADTHGVFNGTYDEVLNFLNSVIK